MVSISKPDVSIASCSSDSLLLYLSPMASFLMTSILLGELVLVLNMKLSKKWLVFYLRSKPELPALFCSCMDESVASLPSFSSYMEVSENLRWYDSFLSRRIFL
jgi:hypothetical protein